MLVVFVCDLDVCQRKQSALMCPACKAPSRHEWWTSPKQCSYPMSGTQETLGSCITGNIHLGVGEINCGVAK